MKHIPVALNSASLAEAIKRLNAYRDSIEPKMRELLNRLKALGTARVAEGFAAAAAGYSGDPGFSVEGVDTPTGCKIIVNGATAVFLEFGAGVTYGYGYPGAKPAGISEIGTYGLGLGSKEEWYYTNEAGEKVYTSGNAPAAVMYNTAQELREAAILIAKEVFASA